MANAPPAPSQGPRSPRESQAIISELMMPNQVNPLGHVFGGVILSMVDRAAAVAAMRHARRTVVTASIDRVDFRLPIYAGELVTCQARVTYVGRTSIEVEVQVEAENPLTGGRRHTNTCYLTFVGIDESHTPVPVPPLKLETDEEKRRFREGELRRAHRLRLLEELGQKRP
ncbi:MAG: acyl-CoA thioesterase [Gemmatimonadetes bacterium]|nr:acyl-CoA thioesterase [Gemmatimonadota bacterium]